MLHTSGFQALDEASDSDTAAGQFVKRAFFGGDLGLGIDVGFTFHLNERTTITGSVLDLGFIYHGNDAKSYSLNGKATYEYKNR